MRFFITLVGAAACLMSSSLALANDPRCTTARVTASAPPDREHALPTDAQIVFATDGGCRARISATLRDASGRPIAAALLPSGFVDGYLYTLRPSAPLAPLTSYSVTIDEEAQRVGELTFTSGSAAYVASPRPPPTLEAVALTWVGPALETGEAMAIVRFTARQRGADRFGIYRLGRPGFVAADAGWGFDGTLASGREEVSISYATWARQNESVCFTLRYEDATGTLSPESASACATPTTAPPPPSSDEPAAATNELHGCSASRAQGRRDSSGVAAVLLAGVLVLVSVRGRRRS